MHLVTTDASGLSAAAYRALRQVRDCGVIRVAADHAGMMELYDEELVDFTVAGDQLDYRLTADGRRLTQFCFST